MGVRGEVFSSKVMLQNRTYFFNVKENRMGDLYLNIVESKNKDNGGFDRQSVILFADDLQEFLKGFEESLRVLEKAVRDKRYTGREPSQRRSPSGSGADAKHGERSPRTEKRFEKPTREQRGERGGQLSGMRRGSSENKSRPNQSGKKTFTGRDRERGGEKKYGRSPHERGSNERNSHERSSKSPRERGGEQKYGRSSSERVSRERSSRERSSNGRSSSRNPRERGGDQKERSSNRNPKGNIRIVIKKQRTENSDY